MILKFQSGGLTAPWVLYTPLSINTASPRTSTGESSKKSSSKGDSDSGNLKMKDVLSVINDIKGLPSDSQKLTDRLVQFVRLQDINGELDPNALAIEYARVLLAVLHTQYNKEIFDKAYSLVTENKGLNELAITADGRIVVLTNDGITAITVNEFDPEKHTPLTNGELANLRANYYANRDDLTRIISNGIGMEKVNSLIHSYITLLGKDTMSVQSGLILAGIELLQQLADLGITIDEAIGNKILTETQIKQAEQALIYLNEALPTNAKTLLAYKASRMKKLDGTSLTADDILISLLSSRISNRQILNDTSRSGKNGKSSEDKMGEGDFTSDQYTNIAQGRGYAGKAVFKLMDSDGFSMNVTGKSYPYILDLTGSNIETMTLSRALLKGIGSMYKGGNYAITFGDYILKPEDLHGVLYESDGSAIRVILPTRVVDGKIVPDLDVAKENRDLIEAINSSDKGLKDEKVQQQLKNSGLFNGVNGELDLSKFLTYLVFNGKSDSKTITANEWVEEIKPTDDEKTIYEKYLKLDNEDYEFDKEDDWYIPGDWFGNFDKMYKGIIFVPISTDLLYTATGMKKHYKENTSDELNRLSLKQDLAIYGGLNTTDDINLRFNE